LIGYDPNTPANPLMRVLDFITSAALVTALFALPFSFHTCYRRPLRSVLVFGIPVVISLCAGNISREKVCCYKIQYNRSNRNACF
jgi:hypothetical protein